MYTLMHAYAGCESYETIASYWHAPTLGYLSLLFVGIMCFSSAALICFSHPHFTIIDNFLAMILRNFFISAHIHFLLPVAIVSLFDKF